MPDSVTFNDYSIEVKTALDETSIAWLYAWAEEIASHAKRNCVSEVEDDGKQLKGSYRADVDEQTGIAQIGSPMEASYWEEFGTGAYADTAKNGGRPGREGWWIYTPGSKGPEDYESNTYWSRAAAEEMAEYIRRRYQKEAVVSNGHPAHYTLEKAFLANRDKAIADLERLLKEKMSE